MPDIINRFGELTQELIQDYAQGRIRDVATDGLRRVLFDIRTFIMFLAPVGRDEPYHGRPSTRLWGTNLLQHWEQVEVEDHPDGPGIRARVDIDHPSVGGPWQGDILDWLIYGTPPHFVPKPPVEPRKVISFWWGSPLRWPPLDGGPPGFRYFMGRPVGAGTFDRGFWAQPQGDFIEEARAKKEGDLNEAVDQTSRTIFYEPLDKSQFLRKF